MMGITFIIVASFFITLIAVASATDYYVAMTGNDETGDGSAVNPWGTIQHAVESVDEGDTIIVRDGTYIENVYVEKSLTIRSDNGPAVTIVQAASTSDDVFYIYPLYVNISGFTITGSTGAKSAGIHLSGENCAIYNNNVTNNYYGIWLDASKYNEITCNWIHHNTEAGFYLSAVWSPDYSGSTDNTIERNNIIENGKYNGTTGGWEWQFDNNQRDDVAAQDNWWGTVGEARINASIYDHYDNEYRGIVNFSFNLSGPDPCAPIPESAPILLFGAGLLALAGYVLREKRL
jgi:parallel beta-helix repeat protein